MLNGIVHGVEVVVTAVVKMVVEAVTVCRRVDAHACLCMCMTNEIQVHRIYTHDMPVT